MSVVLIWYFITHFINFHNIHNVIIEYNCWLNQLWFNYIVICIINHNIVLNDWNVVYDIHGVEVEDVIFSVQMYLTIRLYKLKVFILPSITSFYCILPWVLQVFISLIDMIDSVDVGESGEGGALVVNER